MPTLFNPVENLSKTDVTDAAGPLVRILRLWHVSSLDAPTVAVVWTLALGWVAHLRLPLWAPLLAALGSWAVYIGDRLLDAHAGMSMPPRHLLRERHYFHWKHRRILGIVAAGCGLASLWIVSALLPAKPREADSAVAAAALAYLSGVHVRRPLPRAVTRLFAWFFTRELLVGVLFTAGCVAAAWWQLSRATVSAPMAAAAGCLAVTAWLNCRAIGKWESEGRTESKGWTGWWTAAACFISALAFWTVAPRCGAVCFAAGVSAGLLGMLDLARGRLTPVTLRAAADLVLLVPAVLLWRPGSIL